MNAAAPAGEPAEAAARRSRRRGVVFFAAGVLLVAAAVWTVTRQAGTLEAAWESARTAPWWLAALILVLPLVNWLFSSLVFWVLTNRYGRVGLGEMTALIGSAWLLNNLPMRPGLVGRVAYHRAVNGIPIADSVRVLVCALGCTAAGAGLVLAVAVGVRLGGAGPVAAAGIAAAPALMVGLGATALRRAEGAASMRWRLAVATGLRYGDVLLWGVRYWLVFRLVGAPIGAEGAAIIAAASQAAMVVPVQMGVREWIVGLVGSWLPPGVAGAGGTPGVSPGLLADLVNRAAEVVVALPVGVIAGAWLAGRRRGAAAAVNP